MEEPKPNKNKTSSVLDKNVSISQNHWLFKKILFSMHFSASLTLFLGVKTI